MAKRWLMVLLSDTHANSKAALIPPDIVLYEQNGDPWVPGQTESQAIIWDRYETHMDNVIKLAKKDPIHVVHLGDPIEGMAYLPKALVSDRPSDQYDIAEANLAPWLKHKQVKSLLLVAGTGVHEDEQGTASYKIAKGLAELFKKKSVTSMAHPRIDKDGVVFDLAHHGPSPGIRNWTRGNVLGHYTKSLMMDDLDNGADPPDLLARGHFHQYALASPEVRRGGKTYKTIARILPSYSFIGDFARKAAKSPGYVTIGLVVVEVIDGRIYHVHDNEPDFMEAFDARSHVEL